MAHYIGESVMLFRSNRPAQPQTAPVLPVVLDPNAVPLDEHGRPVQLLYTPAEAAVVLRVPESWLRRRAAARQIRCTFLGRHLRFSFADLGAIVSDHAVLAGGRRRRRRRRSAPRDHDLISQPEQSVDAPVPMTPFDEMGDAVWRG